MAPLSEYELENLFIERVQRLGYQFQPLANYADVIANFRKQLARFNASKLIEAKGEATFSDAEFDRVMILVDNHSVYECAKILRDKLLLTLDNGKTVYLDLFCSDINRNIYQVTRQVTMDKAHLYDVVCRNRFDVTLLINGLPLVQIELKRPGVEINEAINQINRYRKYSFKGLFRFLELFVVSNSVQTKYFCNANDTERDAYNQILKSLVFFWTDEHNKRINNLDDFTADFLRIPALTEMLMKYMVIKTTAPELMVMRPYQIAAVKAAKKRVLEANQHGYIFACTGSGKTLTSFKLAQVLRDEPQVAKVIFLVDRKDLDDQAIDEFNSFEADCVNSSNSTSILVKQFKQPKNKLIVSTIQKMTNALKRKRFAPLMDAYRDQKVVFIIDECHRSQFGKMHHEIKKHFQNANFIGFTGTPIFAENSGKDGKTTADLFCAGSQLDACLHRYTIKEAIADGNVLRFSVEFQRTIFAKQLAANGITYERINDPEYCRRHNLDIEAFYHDEKRIRAIAEYIFAHHEQHVHPQGKDIFTALFAVDYIKTLGLYYNAFKALNDKLPENERIRVAAIFNHHSDKDIFGEGGETACDLLSRCMQDYNKTFSTAFTLDTFDAYRKDISRRMKQQELPQVDILLVVDMMLTGFDAKPLNTLYLDKNLIWHNLVQAYSRTNRVGKVTKQFGQIVSFRDIKAAQDEALRLFSGNGDPNEYLMESYDFYVAKWIKLANELRAVTPTVEAAGHLTNENDIRNFVLAFRALSSTLATLKTFGKFNWDDLAVALNEESYDGFKSWFLYFHEEAKKRTPSVPVPIDVDFDVELVRTDRINVMYIMSLLKSVHRARKTKPDIESDVDLVLREMERTDNATLRAKKDIVEKFIRTRFYDLSEEADLQQEYELFESASLQSEIASFAHDHNLELKDVQEIFSEYTFGLCISEETIRRKLAHYHFGLLKITVMTSAIKDFVIGAYARYKAEGE